MMKFLPNFMRLTTSPHHLSLDTQLVGPRVFLRTGDSEDWKAWRQVRENSREYLEPWEPKWPPDALSYNYFCTLLRRQWRDWRSGKGYAFFIFMHGTSKPVLLGGVTLSDIVYAAAQKGTIGYWIGSAYAGQGLMTEAVNLICDFAFRTLKLQRVEAGCLPHNEASKGVLRRNNFEEEGYAKAYLQINGKREDHLLWGKSNPNLKNETVASI